MNRHHRRRTRRNPGIGLPSAGGIVRTLVRGAQDGFVVVLGRGVTNLVASKIPFGQTSPITKSAVQLLTGVGLSYAVRKITRSDRAASFFLAGAVSKVIEPFVAKLPVIGPALSGYGLWPAVGVGAWARAIPAPRPTGYSSDQLGELGEYDYTYQSDGITS